MTDQYANRMKRVCDFIAAHLDEDLPVEKLSLVANFSKYHFHRLFQSYIGTSVYSYVQMARLKRASYQLAFKPNLKIIDIALDAGFESHEAFSRAFKKTFEQTPSGFRKNPNWSDWHEQYDFIHPTGDKTMDIKITQFETTRIATLEHRGSPALLNNTISSFIEWRKSNQLSPVDKSRTFGIAYSDPNVTSPEDFKFDVCGEINSDIPENSHGVIAKEIPEGRCAVVRHRGSHDQIENIIRELFKSWLPQSGEKVRDFPIFFQYSNFFPGTPESALITDIYLPIE